MTITPEAEKNNMLKQTHTAGLFRYWWIVLLAICLIAIGAYVFFIKGQSRAAKEGQNQITRTVPVVAVAAKTPRFQRLVE